MSASTVRGCTRGLAILRALNRADYASASQLSKFTGLPRPTVYRLLETLVEDGCVNELDGGRMYCLGSSVLELSRGFGEQALATEVARPLVDEFSADIGWPVYVHVFDGEAMITRHVVHSPRALGEPKYGSRVPLLSSSPGRLLLSRMASEKRQPFLSSLTKIEAAQRNSAVAPDNLINEVLRRGCGFRDGGMLPRSCSVALPIVHQDEPLAFVTTVFIRSVVPLEKAIEDYVPPMRELVSRIEGNISAFKMNGQSGSMLAPRNSEQAQTTH